MGGGEGGKKKGTSQTAEYPSCPLPDNLMVLKQAVSGKNLERKKIEAKKKAYVTKPYLPLKPELRMTACCLFHVCMYKHHCSQMEVGQYCGYD